VSDPTPLKIAPGVYSLSMMRRVSVERTDDPAIVCLVFHAADERSGQRNNLKLSIPIPAGDATDLLRTLKILHAKGAIPAFPEGNVGALKIG
jgi:hypothetical protein